MVWNTTLTCAAVGVTPFSVSLASRLKPPPALKVAASAVATAVYSAGTSTFTLALEQGVPDGRLHRV